jgi:hypothetical protein
MKAIVDDVAAHAGTIMRAVDPGEGAAAARAAELVRGPIREVTPEHWQELRILLENDAGHAIDIPRELDGLPPLVRILQHHPIVPERWLRQLEQYLVPWKVQHMEPAARIDAAERVLALPAAQVTREDARTLSTVIGVDGPEALGLSRELPGRYPLSHVLEMVDHPSPIVSPSALGRLQEYVTHRELLRLPAPERLAQTRSLLDQAEGLSKADAARLRALLVADGMTFSGNIGTPGTDGTLLLSLDHLAQTPDVLLSGQQALTRLQLAAYRLRDLDAPTLAARTEQLLATAERTPHETTELIALASHPERDAVLARLTPYERLQLASTFLAHRSIDVNRVIETVAGTRAALDGVSLGPELDPIATRVLDRLDVEMLRMGREAAEGTGYGHHPDYAAVGRIAADLDLAGALARAQADAAAAGTLAW